MKKSTGQHVPILPGPARPVHHHHQTQPSPCSGTDPHSKHCWFYIYITSMDRHKTNQETSGLQYISLAHRSLDRSMEKDMGMGMGMDKPPLPGSLSTVSYCCGVCGYDLKLSSSARDTAGIVGGGARRYGRRGGVVAFAAIDDARFGHVDEFRCLDVLARRLFARRTRLLCRQCGAHLGFGYDDTAAARRPPRYHIKIRALHPASEPSDKDDAAAAAVAAAAAPPSDSVAPSGDA